MKKSGNEMMVAEKVSIPAIATKRGDLIGYGHSSGTEYTLALIFKLGYDISVNSEEWEPEMNNFHNYARQFMAYHYEQAYDRRMEEIDDQIKELEKEKERFEKDIDQLNRKIDNNSKRIEKETDQAKIDEYNFENTAYGEEITAINNLIPPIETKLEELRERRDQLNTEAHTYLGTIGSL
jgi:predicted  nucleic acid-binding Zn-ribbon protein